jgi:hypothetical protein
MPTKAKPKLDESVEAFYTQLLKNASLTDDEIDLLHVLLTNEKVATEFKSGINARKLTDRERAQLSKDKEKQETEYNRKLQELDLLQRTLSTTSTVDVAKIENLEKAIARKEQDIANRDTMLKTVKERLDGFTVDGKSVIDYLGLTSFTPSTSNPVDTTRTVETKKDAPKIPTKEELLKEINDTFQVNAQALARLPFDLLNFQQEYLALTGKQLNPSEFYDKVKEDGTGNYQQVFLKEYNIESLRQQKQENDLRAKIEKELDEKYQQKYSNQLNPQNGGRPKESDFFNAVESTIPKDYKEDNQGMGLNDRTSIISEAVLDFKKRKEAAEARAS